MMVTHPEDAPIKTIVCLDSGTDLFGCLCRILARKTPEYRLIHWVKIPEEMLVLCHKLTPALLVLDSAFAKVLLTDEFTSLISSENLRILVIAESVDQSIYEAYLQKGCRGVLKSNSSDQMLLKSIESVFAGELWVPRSVLSQIVQVSLRKNLPKLTSREAEILKLISHGLRNQQIADHLFISRETVRWHIRGLYSKIGISHRPGTLQHVRYPGRRLPPPSET
jgi:DNA-binding NarL/FixJ family response regulator